MRGALAPLFLFDGARSNELAPNFPLYHTSAYFVKQKIKKSYTNLYPKISQNYYLQNQKNFVIIIT